MKRTSTRFFALLLVLLSIGAFDLHTLFHDAHQSGNAWPVASAAPLYPPLGVPLQARSRKPRVGIVVTNDPTSSSDGGVAPLNTVRTGGTTGSAFENADGRVGMKVQLKLLERNLDSNPLMVSNLIFTYALLLSADLVTSLSIRQLYQRHVNRANSKLATILGRAAPTSESQRLALERRKTSIFARRSAHTAPRQGYTLHPTPPTRRFLASFWDSLFGRTGLESGSKSKSTLLQVSSSGYPQLDLIASQSDNLTLASSPTAVQSLGLAIESNDIGYVANIQLGSLNTTFRMLIDSGSADTWVPSASCAACGSTHQKLGSDNSDSFQASNTPFSIQYGTGDVSGFLATDNVEIAGLKLEGYTFAVTTEESDDFADDTVPFDGLMGLARSELSNAGQPTPIDALYDAKLVQAPVMGYHLGRVADGYNDGEVTFGGVDPAKYTGNITEIENVSTRGFWEAAIDTVSVSGKDLGLDGRTAILDTGTTLIVAPPADADTLHAAIPGSKSDGQGGYTIPCTTTAQVSLTFGGIQFPIDTRDMLFVPVDAGDLTGDCVSAVSAGNVGQNNEWLVGATFLKNVYFATNTKANKIGLARLNTTDTAAVGSNAE